MENTVNIFSSSPTENFLTNKSRSLVLIIDLSVALAKINGKCVFQGKIFSASESIAYILTKMNQYYYFT